MIDDILRIPRDYATVVKDASKMRAEIERHKPPHGPLDVKLGPGGLVDLEFAVHVLQLTRHVGLTPGSRSHSRNLKRKSLVPANIVNSLKLLSRMLVMMRLVAPGDIKPTSESWQLVAEACGAESWDELLAEHDAARQRIATLWNSIRQEASTMISEGDKAPAMTLTASDGSKINLSAPGQPLVLYFYPKDDTSGCTREAQDFTALAGEFAKAGVKVVGVSRDPMKSHEKFIGKYGLAVPLASDEDGSISEAFGTWVEKSMYGRKYMGMERATYLIGADGRVAQGLAQGEGPRSRRRGADRGANPPSDASAFMIISQCSTSSYIARTGMRSSRPWARSSSGEMPQLPSTS